MNGPRPVQFHLSTCLLMMVVAGVTVVPACVFANDAILALFAAFWIGVLGIIREEWLASGKH